MSTSVTPGPETLSIEPGRWTVVPEQCEARFDVADKLVMTVHGTMPVVAGTVEAGDLGVVGGGYVDLDVEHLATGNARRDTDLRKPRFLDATSHRTLRVELDRVATADGGWHATAIVHAKGRSAPVELAVTVAAASPQEVLVHVSGQLDRTPLGIKVPTFIVGRVVAIEADLTFRRHPEA